MDADFIINHLGLQPHPEGGYFREVYRSAESIPGAALPARYAGDRTFGTSIYFLLNGDQQSSLHRLASDEIWYHNLGCAADIHMLHPGGRYEIQTVGPDLAGGEHPQVVIPAGTWFGATVRDRAGFILVSCSVSPGFDFADFTLANRDELRETFPQHADIITKLTPAS